MNDNQLERAVAMSRALKRVWDNDVVAIFTTLWGLSAVTAVFTVLAAR